MQVGKNVRRASVLAAVGGVMVGAAALGLASAGYSQGSRLQIKTLSSRADMVSGGDSLVEVKGPSDLSNLAILVNGQPATSIVKRPGAAGAVQVLVGGLKVGDNTIEAKAGSASARLKVTNYSQTGPIVSGPHMKPYECRTEESGLGRALDADCSVATRVDYFYRTTADAFKPLTQARPADLATTTTIDGKTVPYIVRVESGTINRTIYRIAILDNGPMAGGGASTVWTPSAAWNGRFAVSFGGGAGTKYNQGINQVDAPLNDLYLSRGFAHMVATELVNGLHGNQVLQGESLMMLKEHFIERYGLPKWTVGNGGSGGAIQQLVITQMYPGLLDGLQPTQSFPDSSMNTPDCGLLQTFWKSDKGKAWSQDKKTAVEGFTPGTCGAWERSFVPVSMANYKPGCDLKDQSLIYDAKTNPKGARCAVQEMRVNIYGRDPKTGYAYKAVDNIGLQYGLKGLNEGKISVDEFLQLNEGIGGNDLDGNFVAQRSVGDLPAIRAAYASGSLNSGGGGLANVPILHSRTYTDSAGDIHDRHRDLTIRARLEAANGRSDNQVIWVAPGRAAAAPARAGAAPAAPAANPWQGPTVAAQSLDIMTKWLDDLAADPAPLNTDKVVKHKPAGAVDAYFEANGRKVAERASWDTPGGYNSAFPVHLEPRLIAGAPASNDVLKCALKPVRISDYKVAFTPEQQGRLKAIFPQGVCDFSKKGVGQVALKGFYQRY